MTRYTPAVLSLAICACHGKGPADSDRIDSDIVDSDVTETDPPQASFTICMDGGSDFMTLAEALTAVPWGSDLELCAGAHIGPGFIDKSVNILGAGTQQTFIDVPEFWGFGSHPMTEDSGYVLSVSGVTFRGGIVQMEHGHGEVRFSHSEFTDSPVIQERGMTSFEDCTFHDIEGIAGVLLSEDWGRGLTLTRVRTWNNIPWGDGVQIEIGVGGEVVIRNSEIRGSGSEGVLEVWSLATVAVENSVIHAGPGGGAIVQRSNEATDVHNSILYAPDGYPVLAYGDSTRATVRWSDVYAQCTSQEDCNLGPESGNVFGDPLFVDPAAGDYTLGTGSPAIDAGDPDPAFNDADGTRNDMGAYGGPEIP